MPATEQEVQAQVERLAGLAERPLSDYSSGTYTAPVEPFPAYSIDDLRGLPPASWLIDRVLVAHAFVVLYGPSGVGKSFVALDLALTTASGTPWMGRETAGGWVLYVAAEGSAGITKRIDAWCEERDQPEPERVRFVTDAPNLLDAHDRQRALATILEMPEMPVLIVVDTMARTMVGGDENSARDVGQFIAGVDDLRNAAGGATGLGVHHTGKKGDEERGSSSLRGACDQMIHLSGNSGGLLLDYTKLKDFEPPEPVKLHLAPAAESAAIRFGSGATQLGPHEHKILRTLSELSGSDEPSTTRLRGITEQSEGSFHRALKVLRQAGFIVSTAQGRATFNAITPQGEKALLPPLPNDCHGSGATTATKATPHRGGSGSGSDQMEKAL